MLVFPSVGPLPLLLLPSLRSHMLPPLLLAIWRIALAPFPTRHAGHNHKTACRPWAGLSLLCLPRRLEVHRIHNCGDVQIRETSPTARWLEKKVAEEEKEAKVKRSQHRSASCWCLGKGDGLGPRARPRAKGEGEVANREIRKKCKNSGKPQAEKMTRQNRHTRHTRKTPKDAKRSLVHFLSPFELFFCFHAFLAPWLFWLLPISPLGGSEPRVFGGKSSPGPVFSVRSQIYFVKYFRVC